MTFSKQSFTVSSVSAKVASLLEEDFSLKNIFLEGEILEFVHHSSGHMYMTLVDVDSSQFQLKKERPVLRCTFFRGKNKYSTFTPMQGARVLCKGAIRTYAPNSSYSFNLDSIQELSGGTFLKNIYDLRRKLATEGLSSRNKKILPMLPYKVALITSLLGAALRDIKQQISERYPNVNILLASVLVQGVNAENSIIEALQEVQDSKYKCDVVFLSRGGGSVEDLLPFSGESLAREIARCRLPLVSAIGHQIDHPISDDVADVIASTPTDGAKKVFPVIQDFANNLDIIHSRLSLILSKKIESARMRYSFLWELFNNNAPQRKIEHFIQLLAKYTTALHNNFRYRLITFQRKYTNIPSISILYRHRLNHFESRLKLLSLHLESVSPFKVLNRGYSMIKKDNKIIYNINKIGSNDLIEIEMQDGKKEFIVSEHHLKN